jgi:hypothetical protein
MNTFNENFTDSLATKAGVASGRNFGQKAQ